MPRPPDCSLRASRFRLIRAGPAPGRSPGAGCRRRRAHPGTAREGGSGSLRSHQTGRVPRPRTGVPGVGDAQSARTRPGSRCPDDTDHGAVAASRLARTSCRGGCVCHARCAGGRRLERAPVEVPGLASLPEPFCHGLRCEEFIFASGQSALDERGEVLFAGDLPSQNRYALDGVAAILDGLGANPGDIVKFNTWRAPPPSPQAYRRAAQDRFDFLAAAPPAATGITIPESTGPEPLIRMDAWAMRSTGGGPLPLRTLKPAQHWDWPSPTPCSQGLRCGPWLFVGGQAALDEDGKVAGAGNRADQTELARYVAQVLDAAGACFDDVLKLNTYYCHSVGAGALQGGAEARSRRFSPPGPALSDVPVDELAYPGMLVEIEAIFVRRHANAHGCVRSHESRIRSHRHR